MLRLFRYNVDGERSKIVAEGNERPIVQVNIVLKIFEHILLTFILAHRDLGLLTLVISDTPGLEVCDQHGRLWFPLYVK
jgi:hypothetical protein